MRLEATDRTELDEDSRVLYYRSNIVMISNIISSCAYSNYMQPIPWCLVLVKGIGPQALRDTFSEMLNFTFSIIKS